MSWPTNVYSIAKANVTNGNPSAKVNGTASSIIVSQYEADVAQGNYVGAQIAAQMAQPGGMAVVNSVTGVTGQLIRAADGSQSVIPNAPGGGAGGVPPPGVGFSLTSLPLPLLIGGGLLLLLLLSKPAGAAPAPAMSGYSRRRKRSRR